jgi:hypothetical protein
MRNPSGECVDVKNPGSQHPGTILEKGTGGGGNKH